MKTITEADLRKAASVVIGIPTLYDAQTFFENLPIEEKVQTGYSQIMHNLMLADFLIVCGRNRKNDRNLTFARQLYESSLPHLEIMSEEYPQLRKDLELYLERLQGMSEKIPSLQDIYTKYANAFGGNTQ